MSKASREYGNKKTIEIDALKQLEAEGQLMKAGEVLRYVISDYKVRKGPRSIPVELIDTHSKYDAEKYIELLTSVCNSVTLPFGHSLNVRTTNGQGTLPIQMPD